MKHSQSAITRRQFLSRGSAALTLASVVPGSVLGLNGAVAPNNRVTFGIMGLGNRAKEILPNWLAMRELQVVAGADPRADRLSTGKDFIDVRYGNKDLRPYNDFREMLARKDIDGIYIATGNRWHAAGAMFAAKAGKDVYCEKPVTLTIREGRMLVETCQRYGTIYQAGTQRRSTSSYRFAREMVRQGKIGKLHTVEMQVWAGPGIGHDKPVPPPQGWNYDMWLGQVPWKPFIPACVNTWQYFWDTAEGILADMGCHYTDQMQWTLGTDDTGPLEFETTGELPDPTKFMSDTPITATAKCLYANGVTGVMYQRGAFRDRYIRYIGSEGWIQVDDETDVVTAEPKSILSLKKGAGVGWSNATDHIRNLVSCMRSRTPTACNPEVAHRAMTICEAMNISLRMRRKLYWDPSKERFTDEAANRYLWREPRAPWIA